MQFTTVLVAVLAAAVSAAPTSSPAPALVEKRACQYAPANPQGVSVSKGAPETVGFYTPATAVGACQLEAYFPAGFPISSTGNPQINVIDVDGNAPGSVIGTVTFRSDPNQPTRQFINSFGCRRTMTYRLEIAGQAGSVWYPAQAGAGLRMSYGC